MIPVTVNEIQKGDLIRFTEDGLTGYCVAMVRPGSITGTHVIHFDNEGKVVVPDTATVYATMMIREVQVPCRARRHGDDLITILWNKADGPPPRAVICGACDDQVTADVMAKKPRPEPKIRDRVSTPNGELTIDGFDEDNGTRLSDGRWVCASRFEYLGPNAWKLATEKETDA